MKKPTHYLVLLFLSLILFSACSPKDKSHKIKLISEDGEDFTLQDSIVIKTADGAEIALLVVRNKKFLKPLPTILHHTIYTRDSDYKRALKAAKHGYVGVVSYTRGKAWSSTEIIPYEHEANDVYEVIDWISKQAWSNGEVGMQGGSYTGFTQWAATKKLHPALKTIVPSASSSPGIGEPTENGVFMSFLYPWFPYVSNTKLLDEKNYNDHKRWNNLKQNYYQKGVSYRSIDSLDGTPNPLYNKQLNHPTYDAYWQQMIPYKNEFSNINIPVLSTTGYYDGGQLGVMYYLKEHYKYNKNAAHYLVIGPFGHLGSQYVPEKKISNYTIDSVAQINITELSFQWFDYVLKNAAKPSFLKDKINFQVMGANRWRHVASLNQMSNDTLTFYLSNQMSKVTFISQYKTGNNGNKKHFSLAKNKPSSLGYITQSVDFTDRTLEAENNYYMPEIINDSLALSNGFSFITEAFKEAVEFNGSYFGELKLLINKKDLDCSIVVYEQTPEGKYFKLTQQFIGRASLAKDIEKRQLLTPNRIVSFPFTNVRMTSKKLKKGSRLVLVLNVNKHPHEQVNYGSGKDVSDETILDAGEP
ncbi:CocE/NonD family hydrolase, partial [Winogradskyella sp.]|uniref:CocE/NonD family hydrolase n=1 Tax=Winogradskyella sp. TaxID=1883156 RepID=UPI003AB398E2